MVSPFRNDTDLGMFLSCQLDKALPKLRNEQYPDLWADAGSYFPAVDDLEEGAKTVVAEFINTVGKASLLSQGASNIPLVDAGISEYRYKVVHFEEEFQYNIIELENAKMAGRDIDYTRMMEMRRTLAEQVHKIAVFGDKERSMRGFFNGSNVRILNESYDADDSSITIDDHIDFVADNMRKADPSFGAPDTLLVPPKLHNIWSKAIVKGTDTNVIRYLQDNFGSSQSSRLLRIIWVKETQSHLLEQNGVHSPGTNKDRVVFIPSNNPEVVERKFFPVKFKKLQLKGMDYYITCYCGTSEAIWHYPSAGLYVDIPKL